MSDLSNQAQKLLGMFHGTVFRMKLGYSKSDKIMSVWADDLYAVEAVMSFLETIRDAPAQEKEPSDGAIYAAVSQRDITPEERGLLDGALRASTTLVYAADTPPVQSGQMTETYTEVCKNPTCPRGGHPVEIVGSAIQAMRDRNLSIEHPPGEIGRNRDPIYAPDGKTWYQTALDEAAKRGENEVRIHHLESLVERADDLINDLLCLELGASERAFEYLVERGIIVTVPSTNSTADAGSDAVAPQERS